MSSSQQKPDLEDSINVTEAHGKVVSEAAAASREKKIASHGAEPMTLWVLAACGIVLVIAGGILAVGGSLFAYDATFVAGYDRKAAPGMEDTGPEYKEAIVAYMNKGSKIYSSKCNGCHGAGGQGDGANYPSLVGSDWVMGDTDRFAMIILNGLEGPVSSGKTYGVMPAQGIGLAPSDLAGVMTYVRNSFGNESGEVVTVEMAQAAMEISEARAKAGKAMTGAELAAAHAKALPGESIEPAALVDPMTLEPAPEEGAEAAE